MCFSAVHCHALQALKTFGAVAQSEGPSSIVWSEGAGAVHKAFMAKAMKEYCDQFGIGYSSGEEEPPVQKKSSTKAAELPVSKTAREGSRMEASAGMGFAGCSGRLGCSLVCVLCQVATLTKRDAWRTCCAGHLATRRRPSKRSTLASGCRRLGLTPIFLERSGRSWRR